MCRTWPETQIVVFLMPQIIVMLIVSFCLTQQLKVIWRLEIGLKSHPKDWRSLTPNLQLLVFKSSDLTAKPQQFLYIKLIDQIYFCSVYQVQGMSLCLYLADNYFELIQTQWPRWIGSRNILTCCGHLFCSFFFFFFFFLFFCCKICLK